MERKSSIISAMIIGSKKKIQNFRS
uniref:Uncharacterized protein n=1 Tax=Arundo donax TaxID=35708 RepID=A0A0A9C1R5_ARUDO